MTHKNISTSNKIYCGFNYFGKNKMSNVFAITVLITVLSLFSLQTDARKIGQRAEISVSYHLWHSPTPNVTDPSLPQIQNHIVKIEEKSTFFQVMEAAALEKPNEYGFEYTQYPFGKQITSIGGVEDDEENTIFWMLYVLTDSPDTANPPNSTDLAQLGVEALTVNQNGTYLFWRKVVSNTDP